MLPENVLGVKAAKEKHDVTGVLAFFGEGIKGTLLIGTSLKLLRHFSAKMLFCEEADLTDEMVDDVMSDNLMARVR